MATKKRAEFYGSFVGKPAQAMLDEFGPPDETTPRPTGGIYATYFVPVEAGLTRKVVFDVAADETITRVDYWPK